MTDDPTAASAKAAATDRSDPTDALLHARKMAALGELASGITHDFRNILQTVISALDLIQSRSADPAEVRRLAASALKASERGIGLTKRLLGFARRDPVGAKPTSPRASLENVTETLAHTFEARMNVGIEPPPSDLWPVIVDPTELELALINLGVNARDAMPQGGHIRLGARNVTIPAVERRNDPAPRESDQPERRGPRLPLVGGDYVAVSVSDTGSGMDAATLARAVEPFFTTKPVGKGTGLGLAAVNDLTREAGGALRLITEVGRGTVIELWLPRAPVPSAPPNAHRKNRKPLKIEDTVAARSSSPRPRSPRQGPRAGATTPASRRPKR